MRIVCQQTILMKYHALFVIFEKARKFEVVVCGALRVNSWAATSFGVNLLLLHYSQPSL